MRKENVIPEGMRDIIFEECSIRENIKNRFNEVFDKFGFDEVVTPSMEFYKTFSKGEDFFVEQEVFKFFDGEGRILALRPDMTIPIGRLVATKMKGVELPIRLRYASNIYRVNKSLDGKQNEYLDCGIELIGEPGVLGDIEILTMAIESLKSLNLNGFKVEIGNINFFNYAFKAIGIDEESRIKFAELLENKRLTDLENFIESLGIKDEHKIFLNKLPWLFGGIDIIDESIKIAINEEVKKPLIYLKELYRNLKELGYEKYISFDLGMVPRVNYYTGIIFRGYIDGASRSILSGGRYDNLIGNFGRDIEAIGFSINVDLVSSNYSLDTSKEEVILEYKEDQFLNVFKESLKLRSSGKRVRLKKIVEE